MSKRSNKNKTYNALSEYKWKIKMLGIYSNMMGDKYAKKFVNEMAKNYEDNYVKKYAIPHIILRSIINKYFSKTQSFLGWQIVNEAIKNECKEDAKLYLIRKYSALGIPEPIIKNMLYEICNQLNKM
ncbi:MAG: hypothetical protein RXR08_10875 [Sulfolobaceae archaeon]